MNPRISATDLEEFRRIKTTEWGDEPGLIAKICGRPFKPSWQTVAGACWHRVLEHPERHYDPETGRYTAEPYFWEEADVLRALNHIGDGLWEVKAVKTYPTHLGPVDVVAKVDHLLGLVIQDNKTKFSTKSSTDYEDSLQWRLYLDVHGAEVFRYNLWMTKEPKGKNAKLGSGHLRLHAEAPLWFNFWRYPEMRDDILGWVNEFIAWADQRGLTRYLMRKGTS